MKKLETWILEVGNNTYDKEKIRLEITIENGEYEIWISHPSIRVKELAFGGKIEDFYKINFADATMPHIEEFIDIYLEDKIIDGEYPF